MSAQPFRNDDTAPRLLAYLASVRPLKGWDSSEDERYDRGRCLIERMALTARGDDAPRLRMSAEQAADVLYFVHSSEPRKPTSWWKDTARGPSPVVGFVYVLNAVEANLRSWAGKPGKLTGLALAERYEWVAPSRKPVALPDR
jgi:hypothetical protein